MKNTKKALPFLHLPIKKKADIITPSEDSNKIKWVEKLFWGSTRYGSQGLQKTKTNKLMWCVMKKRTIGKEYKKEDRSNREQNYEEQKKKRWEKAQKEQENNFFYFYAYIKPSVNILYL